MNFKWGRFKIDIAFSIIIVLLGGIVTWLNFLIIPKSLYFVDAGRYADVARNYYYSGSFNTLFTFPIKIPPTEQGWFANLPPVHIVFISWFYHLFGVNDGAVIAESGGFFLLGALLTYFLAKHLFTRKIGIFSALFYLLTPQLYNYAKDGASEPIFISLLLGISLLIVKNRFVSVIGAAVLMVVLLFTKLQSYPFIIIFLLWIGLLNKKDLKKVGVAAGIVVAGVILNRVHILFGHYYITVPLYLAYQQSSLYPADNIVRTNTYQAISLSFLGENVSVFLSKLFYNTYNFFKSIIGFDRSLPELMNPLVTISFIFSNITLFKKEKYEVKIFRWVVLAMFVSSLLLAAASSPLIRYIHPVIPFLIILAADFLYQSFQLIMKGQATKILIGVLLLYFIIPFSGRMILDVRAQKQVVNLNKPYTQQVIGELIGGLSQPKDIIVTNLDTWGSWYGQRRTILIPIDLPGLELQDQVVRVDKVILTDYQRDNENHPLTGEWGMIFDQQMSHDDFFNKNFTLSQVATISASRVYENQPVTYKVWNRISHE